METPAHLPSEKAFTEGAELWILMESSGALFQRMDWLLNFQLTKSIQHTTPALPQRVAEILNRCELKALDFIDSKQEPAWLIASSQHLPNRWVLLIDKKSTLSVPEWWQQTRKKIQSLRAKQVRLFLPANFDAKALNNLISQEKADFTLAFVPYQESTSWI